MVTAGISRAEKILEKEETKLMWDHNICTNHNIEARRPDIVLVKKKAKECFLIDIAMSGDVRVVEKKEKKMKKYRDLCREI